ncbi:MAG: hypothetical protein PF961_17095 [Planctomycetota bacterium]|jgi:hypothetical protein|nr:hypothetical protein [Planctomycetota bacterium]
MNLKQVATVLTAAVVWFAFMTPRISVIRTGTEATQQAALITLVVFSVVLLVATFVGCHFLRNRPEAGDRSSQTRRRPVPSKPGTAELPDTRGTDLLGPGNSSRRSSNHRRAAQAQASRRA